jgi:hypothetical protein
VLDGDLAPRRRAPEERDVGLRDAHAVLRPSRRRNCARDDEGERERPRFSLPERLSQLAPASSALSMSKFAFGSASDRSKFGAGQFSRLIQMP